MFTRLRDLREDHDLKQETLAAEPGIRQTTYSKYELGKIAVPASALIQIADFYHVSLDYLVGRDSETLEPLVVYQALYGERGVWVRPASMWSEHVERDGYSGPRFTYLGE